MLENMYTQDFGGVSKGQEPKTGSESFNSDDDDLSEDIENSAERRERKRQLRLREK